jgi:hypothetical protein
MADTKREKNGRFPKGSNGGHHGAPGRSGRKPAAWREACETALAESQAIPVLKEIISGDIHEQVGKDRDGVPIYADTKNSDRLGAVKFLAGYAHGMPQEKLEVGGDVTVRVVFDD